MLAHLSNPSRTMSSRRKLKVLRLVAQLRVLVQQRGNKSVLTRLKNQVQRPILDRRTTYGSLTSHGTIGVNIRLIFMEIKALLKTVNGLRISKNWTRQNTKSCRHRAKARSFGTIYWRMRQESTSLPDLGSNHSLTKT